MYSSTNITNEHGMFLFIRPILLKFSLFSWKKLSSEKFHLVLSLTVYKRLFLLCKCLHILMAMITTSHAEQGNS